MSHPQSRGPGRPRRGPLATAILLAGLAVTPLSHAYTDEELDAKFSTLQQQLQSNAPRFSVNGYFTFAGSVTDENGGTYNDVSTGDPNLEALSRGALQLEFKISDDTRFVTQLLSRGDQGWQTHAEWAFLAHNINADTTVRAGRLRLPVFLFSETLDVGYTQPWVTPPTELYGLLAFSSYEGIDLRYRFEAAGADWSLQPYMGYARLDSWEGVDSESRGDDMIGFDLTANRGDVTARIGYFASKLSIPDFPLADVAYDINTGVRAALGAGLLSSPEPDLSVDRTSTRFLSVGLRYDDGKVMLLTEYAGAKIDGFFSDTTSCYGTAGYRFGKWMPHLTYSHVRVDDPEEREFASVAWLYDPPGPAPAMPMDNPGGAFIASAFALDQQSWTAGVRYDYRPGIALKAEASLVGDFADGGSGQWIPDGAGAAPDEFWVYRASLDMVF